MNRFLCQSAVLIGLVPAMAAAAPYDGIYRQTVDADCALIGDDGTSVRIADGGVLRGRNAVPDDPSGGCQRYERHALYQRP